MNTSVLSNEVNFIFVHFNYFLVKMVIHIMRKFFSTFGSSVEPPNTTQNCLEILTTIQTQNKIIGSFPSKISSSSTLSPSSLSVNRLDTLDWLFSVSPCFAVNGDQIHIINEPKKFYEILFEKCTTAKKRIVLASLYLGVGKLEKKFLNVMKNNLNTNSNLKINILLDFTRGTRGDIQNSKSMIMEIVKNNTKCSNINIENFCLSLYHTPVLRGITKKIAPSRWNELLGLQHMKIYVFDDSVILSGANLSNDYFTNRQDRYVMIDDKMLANFYENFISKVQEFSLIVNNQTENYELHPNWKLLPYEGKKYDFTTEAKRRIEKFFKDTFQQQQEISCLKENKKDVDTWIFPLIEMGQLGIHHDSIITKRLFSSAIKGSKFKLATGYFNLTEDYMDTITNKCLAECSILMAHPNANGFQGASGPAGGIPAAYSMLAKSFFERLCNAQQAHRVHFYEYQKEGWTYHAKGLWYYLPNSKYPNLTLIGSSNFGERSVNRDLEAQVCIVTCNESLQKSLQNEVENLFVMGSTAENELTSRPIPKWVKAVVKIFKNFF